jgi:hypothetical protein
VSAQKKNRKKNVGADPCVCPKKTERMKVESEKRRRRKIYG